MARPTEPTSAASPPAAIAPSGAAPLVPSLLATGLDRRFRIRAWVVGLLVTTVLRVCHATWRTDDRDGSRLDDLLARGGRVVVVFWHGKYVPLFTLLQGRKACVFASLSLRGKIIAEICQRLGYDCVLLPNNGGATSLALIRDALRTRNAGAFAVDGPRGPYHAVKPGAIEVASQLGFALLPVTMAAEPATVNTARWDRMEVPRLFARVRLAVGQPLAVSPGLTPAAVAAWQERLAGELEALDLLAREMLQRPEPVAGP